MELVAEGECREVKEKVSEFEAENASWYKDVRAAGVSGTTSVI